MRSNQDDRLDTIDGYILYLGVIFEQTYTPDQRTLFAAALAERWLAAYETSFPQASGPQAVLRRAVDAVWDHLRGKKLPAADLEGLRQEVIEAGSSPLHEESPKARGVGNIVRLALECCAGEANAAPARQAAVEAYEIAADSSAEPAAGDPDDLAKKKQVWRQPAVMAEIARQQALLTYTSPPIVNEYMIDFLIRESRSSSIRLQSSHLTMAMNLVDPEQLPGFTASALEGMKRDVPADQLPGLLDAALRSGQDGSPEEQLGRLASADDLKRTNPGMESLSGALRGLASLFGSLQKGTLPGGLSEALREQMDQSASPAEKEHRRLLEIEMGGWTPEQRTAYTAALAERWLTAYEAFSAEEAWGDAGALRRILEAIWAHLQGRKLPAAKRSAYSQQAIDNAPSADDFDAPEALAACEIVDRALDCCATAKNLDSALAAALAACSCYAAMAQGRDYRANDPQAEQRLWQDPRVQAEIARQVGLLELIRPIRKFDPAAVEELRRRLHS